MKSILFLVGSLRAESLNARLARVAAAKLPDAIRDADGVFWTTPEYNYAFPGIVKNAIDWTTRPMLPRHPIVGKPMNVAVATMSPANGIRSLSDLKRIWANCGGVPVTTFDFVLQQAPGKFVEENGVETIEPTALGILRFAIDSLVRAIEGDAGALVVSNWAAAFGAK
jgi:chromate reductase